MKKITMTKKQIYKIVATLATAIVTCVAIALGLTSCKAWRTITTSANYTSVSDSAKVNTTIITKTVEEYTGTKKK